MLFHVTMTHSTENCPVYWPPEKQKRAISEMEKLPKLAKAMNIDLRFMVTGVGHKMYALVEADSFDAMNSFFGATQFKQDCQVEPVGDFQAVVKAFKKDLSRRQQKPARAITE